MGVNGPRLVTGLFLCFSFAQSPAVAETDFLWPRFGISAGSYVSTSDSELRVDVSESLTGTDFNFERDLGADDSATLLSLRLDWLFAERHQLSVGYFDHDVSASRTLERTITIGDSVFPVGAEVEGELAMQQFDVAYTWWVMRGERLGAGLSFGVVYYDIDLSAAATLRVGGIPIATVRESESTAAPVPSIGGELRGKAWERVILYARARWLPEIEIGDVSGESAVYGLGAEFYVWGPLGVGVAYEGNYIKADVDEAKWQGSVDLKRDGWRIYLSAAF